MMVRKRDFLSTMVVFWGSMLANMSKFISKSWAIEVWKSIKNLARLATSTLVLSNHFCADDGRNPVTQLIYRCMYINVYIYKWFLPISTTGFNNLFGASGQISEISTVPINHCTRPLWSQSSLLDLQF